jgi:hypothetical protein
MTSTEGPSLSVVLVTADCFEVIRKTVGHLRDQASAGRLEVVVVAPSREVLGPIERDLDGFGGHQIVEVGEIRSLAMARAEGVRRAVAPVVVLAEDHCYPEPGWAEALIEAHRGPWAAVGPEVRNANPASVVSWIELFINYGPWIEPGGARVAADLPGNNSSYKRELLLAYGPELGPRLEVPHYLHRDLRTRGYRLYLEPAAKVRHLNVTLPSAFFQEHFYLGRRFAAGRAETWSRARRLLYATVGVPWILLQYSRGDLREIWRTSLRGRLLSRGLPVLLGSLVARGLGEVLGFAAGFGDSKKRALELESKRYRHLSPRDRALIGPC